MILGGFLHRPERTILARFAAYSSITSENGLKVTLTSPHNSFFKSTNVKQVNIESTTGSMGILAAHVPTIQQLVPGLIEVVPEESDKPTSKFFGINIDKY